MDDPRYSIEAETVCATALLLRFISLSHRPRHTLAQPHTLTCIHIHNSYTLTDPFASTSALYYSSTSPPLLYSILHSRLSLAILCNLYVHQISIFPFSSLALPLISSLTLSTSCRLLCTLIKFTYIAFRRSNRYHPSRIIIKSQLSYSGFGSSPSLLTLSHPSFSFSRSVSFPPLSVSSRQQPCRPHQSNNNSFNNNNNSNNNKQYLMN